MTEHCQTFLMERNLSFHTGLNNLDKYKNASIKKQKAANGSNDSLTPLWKPVQNYYSSIQYTPQIAAPYELKTIRFQVVIWYVGKIDVVQGRVPATFRVTMFWNADEPPPEHLEEPLEKTVDATPQNMSGDSLGMRSSSGSVQQFGPSSPGNNNPLQQGGSRRNSSIGSSQRRLSESLVWQMHGRQKAVEKELSVDQNLQAVDVPPVSILNVAGSFDTIGEPEVCMLRPEERLMRWTCMYRATLMQDHWRVDDFPHDEHDIAIKLAILANRNTPGATWDKRRWKLGLATADDSQGSTRVPHGLLVDVVSIPEFSLCRKGTDDSGGLNFDFVPLQHGGAGGTGTKPFIKEVQDNYLQVHFNVQRDSSYYDKNIMPLLVVLNLVAVSITAGMEPQDFFERGLLTLNICFVQIGQRMSLDAKLPSVSYQIKMQRILNEYFLLLLFLVLEGMLVYVMNDHGHSRTTLKVIDYLTSIFALAHNVYTCATYYRAAAAADAQREIENHPRQKVMASPLMNLPTNH
jgi:hypothetical protein